MARIKLAYIGGGSTRAPGTMASFMEQGANFQGSEVVLIDLDAERLDLVRTIAEKLARQKGLDLRVTATTDRRAGLDGCDAVLSSFRPGGFAARAHDEAIPLKHGVIGQETQGPGGFFMALRAIHAMQGIVADMELACPGAWLVNYTNPINIVAQAVTRHTAIPTVSLCEGPIIYPRGVAAAAGLDPAKVAAVAIGLNHASWTVRHRYDGADILPHIEAALARERAAPALDRDAVRMLELASAMGTLPSHYMRYYYYGDEILAELQAKPTTRAQDIMAAVPDYWAHYRTQAERDVPTLEPDRSRGGINELELAIDVLDAIFNDKGEVWPVNVTNHGALPDFPDDLVVEVPGYVDRSGIVPLSYGPLPRSVAGLVKQLGEYQSLTADAAWHGGHREAIQALTSNPLVRTLPKAEALYDELAAAHRDFLPERLLR
ncbi:MAG: glycoside hydrolase [Chloroflexia bacterium]|nr:glycoside hydrolase [Chloroflexia bacterium]